MLFLQFFLPLSIFVFNFFLNEDINFQIFIFPKWGKGFPKGRTIRKVMGGGRGIFKPQEDFFSLSNSLP